MLWRAQLGPVTEDTVDVVATPDGGAVVLGMRPFAGGDRDLRLVRVDASGGVLWQRAYGGHGDEAALGLSPHSGGGYLVTGSTTDPTTGERDGFVMLVDANGEVAGCPTVETWSEWSLIPEQTVVFDPMTWTPAWAPEDLPSIQDSPTHASTPVCLALQTIGSPHCSPGVPNSTGLPGEAFALGQDALAANDVLLVARQLPPDEWGYFVTGMGTGTVIPPGAQGRLCLDGAPIHRYVGGVAQVNDLGALTQAVDVNAVPGHGAIQAGETWSAQAWHRDGATSNFSDAVSITYQ